MALSEMERATNRAIDWQTVVEMSTDPETYGVRNPITGELLYSELPLLKQAGYIISDLKTFGEVQPQHVP
jgi:hypothetical protein